MFWNDDLVPSSSLVRVPDEKSETVQSGLDMHRRGVYCNSGSSDVRKIFARELQPYGLIAVVYLIPGV